MEKPIDVRHMPASTQPIQFHVPYAGIESKYVDETLSTRQFDSRGPSSVASLEMLRHLTGVERILLTGSCTAALELVALTMDIGPGSEVIVPSYTFSSTANAFLRAGATVRFADIDEESLCITPATVEPLVTTATKSVVPVHYGGLPANTTGLNDLCSARGLWMIEDAAQAIGVQHDGRHLGTHGHAGAISFHHTKNVHCGFGGLFIAGADSVDFEKATFIWERGTDRSNILKGIADKYTWREVGGSFELGELAASVLRGQLEHLDRITAMRASLFDTYALGLREMVVRERLRLLTPGPKTSWNYHAAIVVFATPNEAETARVALQSAEIAAYIGYVPLHSSPHGRRLGNRPEDLPVTEALFPRILRLPLHTEMTAEDALRVCRVVSEASG